MNLSGLNRKQKEELFTYLVDETQRYYLNPIEMSDSWVPKWEDEMLDKQIKETISHLKFMKVMRYVVKPIALLPVFLFVAYLTTKHIPNYWIVGTLAWAICLLCMRMMEHSAETRRLERFMLRSFEHPELKRYAPWDKSPSPHSY